MQAEIRDGFRFFCLLSGNVRFYFFILLIINVKIKVLKGIYKGDIKKLSFIFE